MFLSVSTSVILVNDEGLCGTVVGVCDRVLAVEKSLVSV